MKKKITKVTVTLQDGTETFTAEGDNRISSTGLAISTIITYGNGAVTPTAQVTIYGLPIETMNKLFRVQWNTMKAILNTIKIEVGEQGSKLAEVYNGNITFATVNMDGAPNVSLVITSQMAIVDKMKFSEPFTIPKGESAQVSDVIRYLASEMGYEFENFGVDHTITDASLNGSNIEKIELLAQWCDFDLYIEQKSITICAKGHERIIKIPLIRQDSGLIGYPAPDQRGIFFRCAYDPLVRFGGVVKIEGSIISVANADWRVYGLISTLESNIPNGKWEMAVNATWRDAKDAAVQR